MVQEVTPEFPILPFGASFEAAIILVDGTSAMICRGTVNINEIIPAGHVSIHQESKSGFTFTSQNEETAFNKTLETLPRNTVPLLVVGDSLREKDGEQLIRLTRMCRYKYPQDLGEIQKFYGHLWYLRNSHFDQSLLSSARARKEKGNPEWGRFAKRLDKKGSGLSKEDVVMAMTLFPGYENMTVPKFDTWLGKLQHLLTPEEFQKLNLKVSKSRNQRKKR